jgi:hypothetical protein
MLAAAAVAKPSTAPSAATAPQPLHNIYEGSSHNARQLTETVSAFLARLPPSTTTHADADAWLWIANPYVRTPSQHKQPFVEAGKQLLAALATERARLEAANPGAAPGTITRRMGPLRKATEAGILDAAAAHGVTTGKWMLFPAVEEVDLVWAAVAAATAGGELGVAAKVETAAEEEEGDDGGRGARLACVYTRDFRDEADVRRVLVGLKERGLVGRWGLSYKCGECSGGEAYDLGGRADGGEMRTRILRLRRGIRGGSSRRCTDPRRCWQGRAERTGGWLSRWVPLLHGGRVLVRGMPIGKRVCISRFCLPSSKVLGPLHPGVAFKGNDIFIVSAVTSKLGE